MSSDDILTRHRISCKIVAMARITVIARLSSPSMSVQQTFTAPSPVEGLRKMLHWMIAEGFTSPTDDYGNAYQRRWSLSASDINDPHNTFDASVHRGMIV